MQLRYLNFYKIISQFASNITGAFIALIIFETTGKVGYAFAFVVSELLLRVLFNIMFRKIYYKYPQIILLLRVVPILAYSLSIFLIDVDIVLGVVLVGIFFALQVSFKEMPMEIVLNYSSGTQETKGSSMGITRLLEQLGLLAALIMGGLFLDHLPKWIVIVISIVAYLIAVIPLIIYYVKERKNPTFNKDTVSNALDAFKDSRVKNFQKHDIRRKLFRTYGVTYALVSAIDACITIFLIYLFDKTQGAGYSYAGYIQAAYYTMYGIGYIMQAKLNEKKDLTVMCLVCGLIDAAIICTLPFVVNYIGIVIGLFGLLGFTYAALPTFMYSRALQRARIMGVSNQMLFARTMGYQLGAAVPYLFCCFCPLITGFFVMAALHGASGIVIPFNEEHNRERLVDYLQNNRMY